MPQPRIEMARRGQHQRRAVTILDVGWVHHRAIGTLLVSVSRWRLRPLTFLPASYPRGPPLWVVLTDWLSITPAEGLASRPAAARTRMTKA